MTWMTLETHRTSDDAAWLRDTFPVDFAKYPHQVLAGEQPTRALSWTLQEPRPLGWVNLSTGSLLLIEAIGSETRGGGTLTARLWIAPVNRIVELARTRRYTDDEYLANEDDHEAALEKLLTDVAARFPYEAIPGLAPREETASAE